MFSSNPLKSLWDPTSELFHQASLEKGPSEKPDTLIHRLHLQLQRRLGSPYPGVTKGLFKGLGLDLLNLREYQPGDDIRKIDWNVLARTGIPHVKEHFDEKQLPVWIVVDGTETMTFGQLKSKLDFTLELTALLGLLVLKEGHRIGLVFWQGDQHPLVIRPQNSLTHLKSLLNQLDNAIDQSDLSPKAESPSGFPALQAIMSNRGLVFLLSDFQFLEHYPEAMDILVRLRRKHELIGLMVVDPVEEELVYQKGWLPVQSTKYKTPVWLNTSDRWMIKEYRQAFKKRVLERQHQLLCCCRVFKASTRRDAVDTLTQWMQAV